MRAKKQWMVVTRGHAVSLRRQGLQDHFFGLDALNLCGVGILFQLSKKQRGALFRKGAGKSVSPQRS